MGNAKITLYVDVISPFAYQAYWLTRNSPVFTKSNLQITYTPILLGGLMQATGNTPPINIRNKDKWISNERDRWTKLFSIPMSSSSPQPFPQPTVLPQRALTYISLSHPSKLPGAIDALYRAFWVEGVSPIGKEEAVHEALRKEFGKDFADEVVGEGVKKGEVKELLKKNTEQAFKDGAFGLPWFVATNQNGETEGFWGVDHLGQLLDFLGVKAPREGGFKALL